MKRKTAGKTRGAAILCAAVLCTLVLVAGCTQPQNQSGHTLDEPGITAAYLSGEYTAQLLRDGAEYVFGTIAIAEDDDDGVTVLIAAKQYVEDAAAPEGFYIADRNLEQEVYLSDAARIVFLPEGAEDEDDAIVMGTDAFVAAIFQEGERSDTTGMTYDMMRHYHIYVMGDQIALLIAMIP